MNYSTLGNTDIRVSKICLGTMTFGQQNTEADGHAQLDYALTQGINFLDAAEMYPIPSRAETQGSTERIIGTWLKKRNNRDNVVIATKIVGPSPAMLHIRNPLHINRAQILKAVDGSLERLQTDFIDLYQIHWPERQTNYFGKLGFEYDPNDPWKDNFLAIVETFYDLTKAGKIRYFGVSNETAWGLMQFLRLADKHVLTRCATIQNPYSLINRTFEINLAEIAIREKIALLAYSPLGFGTLSGKYQEGSATAESRLNQFPQYTRYSSPEATQAVSRYLEIAKKNNLSPTQMALAFVNSRPFVTSNIIGATTLEQLKENVESVNVKLSDEVLQEIQAVHKAIPNPAP